MLEELYVQARAAKDSNDKILAEKLYCQILEECPNDWEALYYSLGYKILNCSVEEIPAGLDALKSNLHKIVALVKEIDDSDKRKAAIKELFTDISALCPAASVRANQDLQDYGAAYLNRSINYNQKIFFAKQNNYYVCLDKAANTLYYFGELTLEFSDELAGVSVWSMAWQLAIQIDNNGKRKKEYSEKLKSIDPSYQPIKKGGCYVATCVYGSYDCPEVWTLRRYRDNTLGATWYGRLFIKIYYAISPTIVKLFGKTKWFKKMWKGRLDKMVANLKAKGVEDTPYDDKVW